MDLTLFGKYKGNHGPSRVTQGLSRALAECGHDVNLLTYGDREDLPAVGVDLKRVGAMPTSVKGWSKLYQNVRDQTSESDRIFHTLERYPYTSDVRTVQWTSDMYIVWRRTGVQPPLRSLAGDIVLNWYSRKGAKRAKYVVVQSPETERQMNRYWRMTSDQIIPLGIEEEFLCRPSEINNPPQVLVVGRIDLRKGQVAFLEEVNPNSDRYDLSIVGGMTDREYGKPIIERWSESYRGYLTEKELETAYEDADIVVVPSYLENFSMVGLEALAKGCALVITSDCGLAQFDWATEKNGIFVAGNRTNAAQIVDRVSVKSDLSTYQQRAYQLATNLTWKNIAQKYTRLYEDIQRH